VSWIAVSIFGYFLNSVAMLSDKIILRRAVPHPAVFTFYTAGLGAIAILLFPLAPGVPPLPTLMIALLAGALFTAALYTLYSLLTHGDVSIVGPVIGSLTPAWTLLVGELVLQEYLPPLQLFAFFIILAGSVLVAHEHRRFARADLRIILLCAFAALLFALSFVFSKYIYLEGSFLNGFLWRTVGASLAALVFLIRPATRRAIVNDLRRATPATDALFLIGKVCGGLGFVVLNYAFTMGSVALIQALVGTQHIFLLFFIFLVAYRYPHLLAEHLRGRALTRKFVSIVVMSVGIGLLFL